MTIPKGWTKYQAVGQCVTGTKILPFKVPLKLALCEGRIPETEWFTPAILLQKQPRLKTIIDLTDTHRYYDPQEFERNGVTHIKINITGGGRLPPSSKIREFFEAVDEFMEKYSDDPDALIGVHCTHGLNRTGYFICNYMVNRLKVSPEDAISQFQSARGYEIERQNFVSGIFKGVKGSQAKKKPKQWQSNNHEYSSPLSGNYDYEEVSRRAAFRRRPNDSPYYSSADSGSHIQQNYRNRGYQDNQETHITEPTRNVWNSWQSHSNRRKSDNQGRNSSSSSSNWRERP